MTLRTVSLWAVVLDQVTKYLVVHYCKLEQSVTLIRGFLYITYIQNPGAAFGFLSGTRALIRVPFFIFITLGAGIVVYSYQRFLSPEKKWARFALGLIWGGAMGNFIDRIFYRQVIDFIDARYHLYQWYVFNVADSCITVGLTILVLSYWFENKDSSERGY